MLETIVHGAGKDIVRDAELFDVSQALKVFSGRFDGVFVHTRDERQTYVSINVQIHGENETVGRQWKIQRIFVDSNLP